MRRAMEDRPLDPVTVEHVVERDNILNAWKQVRVNKGLVFSSIIIISWRIIVGSTKKRVQEKIDLKNLENYNAEIKRLKEF